MLEAEKTALPSHCVTKKKVKKSKKVTGEAADSDKMKGGFRTAVGQQGSTKPTAAENTPKQSNKRKHDQIRGDVAADASNGKTVAKASNQPIAGSDSPAGQEKKKKKQQQQQQSMSQPGTTAGNSASGTHAQQSLQVAMTSAQAAAGTPAAGQQHGSGEKCRSKAEIAALKRRSKKEKKRLKKEKKAKKAAEAAARQALLKATKEKKKDKYARLKKQREEKRLHKAQLAAQQNGDIMPTGAEAVALGLVNPKKKKKKMAKKGVIDGVHNPSQAPEAAAGTEGGSPMSGPASPAAATQAAVAAPADPPLAAAAAAAVVAATDVPASAGKSFNGEGDVAKSNAGWVVL
jgi:hypothetical protein